MFRYSSTALASLVLTACAANLPLEKNIGADRVSAASRIVVFNKGHLSEVPTIAKTLGPIEGHSCKHNFWDPVSEKDALQQVQLKALDMGANGIVQVQYDWSGTELTRNCWKSVTASGVAVIFQR